MLQWRQMGLVIILLVGLAACGDGDSDTPRDTPVPTAPPTSVLVDIATWTPAPSPTLRPTLTPAPTMTSAIVNPTFAAPAETGLSEQDDQVIVTALEADLNTAVAELYATSALAASNGTPVVTLEPGSQLRIEVSFVNAFLDRRTTVDLYVNLEIVDGQIRLKELQENRAWAGPTPSDPQIWDVIDLVQLGINDLVFDVLRNQPGAGSLKLIQLRQFPEAPQVRARLEAVFAK